MDVPNIGVQAATRGEFKDAERIFQAMLQKDDSSASVWSNLGNVHMQLGRPELAVDEYTKAVQLAPEAPVPYLNRAIAEEELGVRLVAQSNKDSAQQL